jgi:5-(carboxyamino)imidazole ribonucleotide synthase
MTEMRIGIIGAGQLGRMLALAGYPLGLRFTFLDPNPDACGAQVGDCIVGAYDDPIKLHELAAAVDVLSFEFENVPVATLATAAQLKPLHPPLAALAASQDRLTEKNLFRQLGIATPAFRAVDSLAELQQAVAAMGLPGILKTRRLGYDGRGQYRLRKPADVAIAWNELGGVPLIYEAFVPFSREVSVIGARSTKGEIAIYPLTENVHQQGVLHVSTAPYKNAKLQTQADKYLKKLLKHFDYVGVLTIEFFVLRGQLIANEMAPRVHNSGHWTIEGAETSQFENHLRAICGMPLGSTAPRGQVAMLNFIGHIPGRATALKQAGVHFHDYGKPPRPARKLGHATIIARTAIARARALKKLLTLLPKSPPRLKT